MRCELISKNWRPGSTRLTSAVMSRNSLDIPMERWFDCLRTSVFQPIDAKSTEPLPFDCEHTGVAHRYGGVT